MKFITEILHFKELDSTNNYAHTFLKEKKNQNQEGILIYTDFQCKGRGQAENFWESEAEKNLLLSIICFPDFLFAEEQFILSKFFSVAIVEFLQKNQIFAKIKWPNDIYIGNKKVGGILIENTIVGNKIKNSILGLGLNINQSEFSKDIPNPTSLLLETQKQFSVSNVLNDLIEIFSEFYLLMQNSEYQYFEKKYLELLYCKDEIRKYKHKNQTFEAKIFSISEYGQLILEEIKSKEKLLFNFKEVELII